MSCPSWHRDERLPEVGADLVGDPDGDVGPGLLLVHGLRAGARRAEREEKQDGGVASQRAHGTPDPGEEIVSVPRVLRACNRK